jgi:hypothetical protein
LDTVVCRDINLHKSFNAGVNTQIVPTVAMNRTLASAVYQELGRFKLDYEPEIIAGHAINLGWTQGLSWAS